MGADQTLAITDRALAKVKSFRAGVTDAERQAMWVEVTGISGAEFAYNMTLKPLEAAAEDDAVEYVDDLPIVVPARDVDKLTGATIDWSDDLMRGGLMLLNPNKPSPAMGARAPADMSGPVPQRVQHILDEQINPAIAMHGGSAELVAVEDATAYLRLGGGCVGCGMASVTLTQGIEVAITEAIPEITSVVDVTDHASGTNPYYEPAKK
jgi:Fe/S biogenesis protein NfuA